MGEAHRRGKSIATRQRYCTLSQGTGKATGGAERSTPPVGLSWGTLAGHAQPLLAFGQLRVEFGLAQHLVDLIIEAAGHHLALGRGFVES